MVTVKQIARMCGVSVSTVSNVLNNKPKVSEDTREKVLKAVKETGYTPNYFAQGIRKREIKAVGIITEELSELFTTAPMVDAIQAYCEERGYRTILINLRLFSRWNDSWFEDDEKYQSVLQPALTEMMSIKVEGICYIAGHGRKLDIFPENFPIPAVVLYAHCKNPNIPCFVPDDEKGAYEGVNYLIEHGHKNIGIIAGDEDIIHTEARLKGAKRALSEAGLELKPDWLRYSNYYGTKPCPYLGEMISQGVTAVFSMADLITIQIYRELENLGMNAGEELSVVSFDNRDFSGHMSTGLTTVDLPLKSVGTAAIEELIKIVESGEPAEKNKIVRIPGFLVERESVKTI